MIPVVTPKLPFFCHILKRTCPESKITIFVYAFKLFSKCLTFITKLLLFVPRGYLLLSSFLPPKYTPLVLSGETFNCELDFGCTTLSRSVGALTPSQGPPPQSNPHRREKDISFGDNHYSHVESTQPLSFYKPTCRNLEPKSLKIMRV